MWGATRRLKLGELEGEYAAVEEELDDPTLSHTARIKYRNLKRQLFRDMNEMTGQLPTRSTVGVESPVLTRILGVDLKRAGLDGSILSHARSGPPLKPLAERVALERCWSCSSGGSPMRVHGQAFAGSVGVLCRRLITPEGITYIG
jgi:hypothetical protein